jgi:S-formylglutathione hydrolase FrmB
MHRVCRRVVAWVTVAAAAACFAGAGAGAGIAHASPFVTITIPAKAGEIPAGWLPYSGPARANVLLPAGYTRRKRYPLLVFLGGLGGDYAADAVPASVDALGAIVVMPEAYDGWYTDWWNNGERGGPAWESYELNEVLPTILARYPILPQRRYHAIAGISMGGLGAAFLGGRLPGFFGSVASLSGFVDLDYAAPLVAGGMGLLGGGPAHGDNDPDPVDGPPGGFYMLGHNPANLAVNLRQTRVFQSTGTGVPSSAGLGSGLGGLLSILTGSVLEGPIIYPMNQLYHQALVAAGVNVTYQVHTGGHDLPDFDGEIAAMIAWGPFKPVLTDPSSWTNETVATSGQLWDIAYRFDQPPDAVVTFQRNGASLAISAAGSAVTITTTGGCVIRTPTPATVTVPARTCVRAKSAKPHAKKNRKRAKKKKRGEKTSSRRA